jgi:hypothetical protein
MLYADLALLRREWMRANRADFGRISVAGLLGWGWF